MKSYLSLISISAKVRGNRNRLTVICIVVAVFLVTTIFSMAEMGIRMEKARLLTKHSELTIQDILTSNLGQTLFLIVTGLFLLILIAGVLMISGSINSNVAQRTQFFGMMRCIGMSKQQVIRFVRLEALSWCKVAVPLGVMMGVVITWCLCTVLRYFVGEEFSNIPLFGVSIVGITAGISIGIITVLIAARVPAKHAAQVTPIAAVSGNAGRKISNECSINMRFFNIETTLGINHAISIRKNLFFTAGSFALCIVLFLCFSVLVNFVDYLMPQSHATADIEISSNDSLNSIDSDLLNALREVEGIKNVYGRRSAFDIRAEVGLQNPVSTEVDVISYDQFDLNCLKKDNILKKGSILPKVFGNSHYILSTWDKNSMIKIGDKIKINNEIFEIAGLLKYNPFSNDGDTQGKITIITSSETFIHLTKETGYQLVMIQTYGNITNKNIREIHDFIGEKGTVKDRRDQKTVGTYMAFMFFVYSFLAIITIVTLLNIINSISISVSARMRYYGMMRAVGMGAYQIKKMVIAESITYVLPGCIIGCLIGVFLNRLLFAKLIENYFNYAV